MKLTLNMLFILAVISVSIANKINNIPENTLGYKKLVKLGANKELLQAYKFIHFSYYCYTEIERNLIKGEYSFRRITLSSDYETYTKKAINYLLYSSKLIDNRLFENAVLKEIYLLEDVIEEVTRRVDLHNSVNAGKPLLNTELPLDSPKIPIVPSEKYPSRELTPIIYPSNQDPTSSPEYKKLEKLGNQELLQGYSFIHEVKFQFRELKSIMKESPVEIAERKWNVDSYLTLAENAKNFILHLDLSNLELKSIVIELVYSLDDIINEVEKEKDSHNRIIGYIRNPREHYFQHSSKINISITEHQNYRSRVNTKKPIPPNAKLLNKEALIPNETPIDGITTQEYLHLVNNNASTTLIEIYLKCIHSINTLKQIINDIPKFKHRINFDDYVEYAETNKYNFLYKGNSQNQISNEFILNFVYKMDEFINYFETLIASHNIIFKKEDNVTYNSSLVSELIEKISYPKYDRIYELSIKKLKEQKASSKTLDGVKYIYDCLKSLFSLEIKISKANIEKINIDDYVEYYENAKKFILFNSKDEPFEVINLVSKDVSLLDNSIDYLQKRVNKINYLYSSHKEVKYKVDNKTFIPRIEYTIREKSSSSTVDSIYDMLTQINNSASHDDTKYATFVIGKSIKLIEDTIIRMNTNFIDYKANFSNIYDHINEAKVFLVNTTKYSGQTAIVAKVNSLLDLLVDDFRKIDIKYNANCNYCKDLIYYEIPNLFSFPPLTLEKLIKLTPKKTDKAELSEIENKLRINGADNNIMQGFKYISEAFIANDTALINPNQILSSKWDFYDLRNFVEDSIFFINKYQISNSIVQQIINNLIKLVKEKKEKLEKIEMIIFNSSSSNEVKYPSVILSRIDVENPKTSSSLYWKKTYLAMAGASDSVIKSFEYIDYCFKNNSSQIEYLKKKISDAAWNINKYNEYCQKSIYFFLLTTLNTSDTIKKEAKEIINIVKEQVAELNGIVDVHNNYIGYEEMIKQSIYFSIDSSPEVPSIYQFEDLNLPPKPKEILPNPEVEFQNKYKDFFIDVEKVIKDYYSKQYSNSSTKDEQYLTTIIINSLISMKNLFSNAKINMNTSWNFDEYKKYNKEAVEYIESFSKYIINSNVKNDIDDLLKIYKGVIESIIQFEKDHNYICSLCTKTTYFSTKDSMLSKIPEISNIVKPNIIQDDDSDLWNIEYLDQIEKKYEFKATTGVTKIYYKNLKTFIGVYKNSLNNLKIHKANQNTQINRIKDELKTTKERILSIQST